MGGVAPAMAKRLALLFLPFHRLAISGGLSKIQANIYDPSQGTV